MIEPNSMSLAGGFFRIGAPQVRELPIALSSDDVVIKVEEIVDKILSSNGEPIDKLIAEIDEIVYQIYELTDEEIYVIKQGRC